MRATTAEAPRDGTGSVWAGEEQLFAEGAICVPVFNTVTFGYDEITGAALHPQSAYMILRGMKTLELRMQRHNENGMLIASYLSQHPKVDQVFYPGLETHASHDIAKKQMQSFGGMMSFSINGGFDKVVTVLENLRFAHKAASLGSVGTLAGPPRATSHVELTEKERADAGIPESLIRYSAGFENAQDMIADLEQAFARPAAASSARTRCRHRSGGTDPPPARPSGA